MPGEMCWLGAGCFNWARPLLRGFEGCNATGRQYWDTTGRNPWTTGKTNRILNREAALLLAASCGSRVS